MKIGLSKLWNWSFIRNLKRMNTVQINRIKLKSILDTYAWILYIIPLFIIVSFLHGIKTGLILSGIIISGISLGVILPVAIATLFKKSDLQNIYGEIVIFMISTTLLSIHIPDKKLLG